MSSFVETGEKRGQSLGFPTANLSWPDSLFLPKIGGLCGMGSRYSHL